MYEMNRSRELAEKVASPSFVVDIRLYPPLLAHKLSPQG